MDYLQAQRIRMMMLMKLAEATAHVDVYLGPGNGGAPAGGGRGGAGSGGRGGAGGGAAGAAETPTGTPPARQTAGQRHSSMANLATHPAVAVPNGFNPAGHPTSITFFARPFLESELLAVVKAYQDATDFHRKPATLESRT